MTPNEEMNQAVTPILESMRTQGVCTREIEIYRNGFYVGAMWRASQQPHNDKSVDWNHRRYEIAKALLPIAYNLYFSNKDFEETVEGGIDEEHPEFLQVINEYVLEQTDELIKQLKGG